MSEAGQARKQGGILLSSFLPHIQLTGIFTLVEEPAAGTGFYPFLYLFPFPKPLDNHDKTVTKIIALTAHTILYSVYTPHVAATLHGWTHFISTVILFGEY